MADNPPNGISLGSATRTNLLSLQNTTDLIGRTQQRLATGLKVNSPLDDALAYFKARNLNARAADLQNIKDNITGAVSVITAATQGLTSIESVLKQMKALAQSAVSAPESTTRAKLASQFNELRTQVNGIAADASFNGVNLLKNTGGIFEGGADQLTVKFNERTDPKAVSKLVVSGLKVADFRSIMARSALATGAAVVAGWLFTYQLSQASFAPVTLKSLTFSGPSAELLMLVLNSAQLRRLLLNAVPALAR